MFKFLKNLFKRNNRDIINHLTKLNNFKISERLKYNNFVFKFNDYGYVYEIKLEDALCELEIFERSKNYSTSIIEDEDWYNYISGSWDDELINTINSIHRRFLRDKQKEEYEKLSKEEKAKVHFNKKFQEADEQLKRVMFRQF